MSWFRLLVTLQEIGRAVNAFRRHSAEGSERIPSAGHIPNWEMRAEKSGSAPKRRREGPAGVSGKHAYLTWMGVIKKTEKEE